MVEALYEQPHIDMANMLLIFPESSTQFGRQSDGPVIRQ